MKLGKLLLVAVSAAVLMGALLVSTASARNRSISSQTWTSLWRRMDFAGGPGTIECEVKLSGSFHSRTITKTVNSLIGYITEGTVLRCIRGSMTINQASLPWHLRYRAFGGTLPNITSYSDTLTGAELRLREPLFGATCTVSNATWVRILVLSASVVSRTSQSGTNSCSGLTVTLSGEETNITNGAGSRLTVTLI